MKRTSRRVVRNTVALLMTIFFLMALVAEFSSGLPLRLTSQDVAAGQTPVPAPPVSRQTQVQARQARSANPDVSGLVKLGQFAPDFELPKLTFKTDDTGKPIGVISEKDKVRLSSFRGKKPVCLIMSSYT